MNVEFIFSDQLSKGEEYDAAYAATVAAVAYAIAAMEEGKAPSQERKPVPERVASRKKQVPVHAPADAAPPVDLPPPRRGESMKRPVDGSKISRWFSGKEQLVEDGDDDQRGMYVKSFFQKSYNRKSYVFETFFSDRVTIERVM
jgi:hypothetical protein